MHLRRKKASNRQGRTYLAVSLPSLGAMAPPDKMLSPRPKSTCPGDQPEFCCCFKLSVESFGKFAAA